MATVGELFVKLMLDDKNFKSGMADAEKSSGGFASKLGTVGGVVAGVSASVVAGGAALLGMATSAASATDRIDKMSQKLGMTRQGFQEWDFILSQNGTSIDTMGAGMKSLTKRMDDFMQGSESAYEPLERLGLTFDDLQGKTQEQTFETVVTALQGMEDGAEKSALALELFGRSGQELMPLLNGSAESVEDLKNKAADLGLVLGDEAVDAGVQFTDAMDQLKRSFGNLVAQIGVDLMPVMLEFVNWVLSKMPEIKEIMSVVFGVIETVVTTVIDIFNEYLLPVLEEIFGWVKENMPTIQAIFKTVFDIIAGIVKLFADVVGKIWDKFGDTIMEVIKTAFDIVVSVVKTATDVVNNVIKAFTALINGDWKTFGESLKNIWKAVWEGIRNIVQSAWGLLSGAFQNLWSSISGWFSNLASNAVDWGRNMIQGFVDGIKSMIGKVKNAVSNVMNAAADFIGFNSPSKKGEGRNIVKWGQNMVGGFTDGINNALPSLQATMDRVIPSLDGAGNSNRAVSNNFGGVTVQNMNVRNDADIDLVARKLFDLQTRRGRGLGMA